MRNFCLLLVLAVLAPWTQAQIEPEPALAGREALEHQRIREQRTQAMAQFSERDAGCYQRFAVNNCLAEVRTQRRAVLADLRRQETSLNDAQRKRRAADQLLRSDDKAAGRP